MKADQGIHHALPRSSAAATQHGGRSPQREPLSSAAEKKGTGSQQALKADQGIHQALVWPNAARSANVDDLSEYEYSYEYVQEEDGRLLKKAAAPCLVSGAKVADQGMVERRQEKKALRRLHRAQSRRLR